MKTKYILFTVISCLLVSWLPAYEGVQRSDLMESKADIVVRISNGAAFIKAINDSSVGKLWNSPEMKPFINNQNMADALVKYIFLPSLKPSAKEEALHLNRQILSLLKGETVFGFNLGEPGKETGEQEEAGLKFYALAEMDEAAYKKSLELFKQESKVIGEKVISHRHTFQGVEMIQDITIDGEKETTEWTAFCGNTYINGSSRQWVEQCIVRLKKELPAKPSGPPCFQVWMPDGFFERVLKALEPGEAPGGETSQSQSPDRATVLKAMGFDGVGKVSLEWIINPSHSEINIHIRNKGIKKGLWTLFSRDPVPHSHFLGYVPEGVLSYQVTRLNVHDFWQEIPSMLEAFGPQASAQFRMGLQAMAQMLQVDVDRDIVAHLDTVLTYYTLLEGSEDAGLYVWQLRSDRAIEKTLAKLFTEGGWMRNMMKENFELLELQGHSVYSFKVPRFNKPAQPGQEGTQQPPDITWTAYGITVVDGDLVFGRLNLLRSYIHGSQDNTAARKFYKSRLFTRLMRRVPDNAIGYGFSDVTQWIEPAAKFLKNLSISVSPSPPPGGKGENVPEAPPEPDALDQFVDNLKFERLPAVEFLRSFFGPWMSYYQFNGKELIVKWEFHNARGK
jgi:hypothetical protein